MQPAPYCDASALDCESRSARIDAPGSRNLATDVLEHIAFPLPCAMLAGNSWSLGPWLRDTRSALPSKLTGGERGRRRVKVSGTPRVSAAEWPAAECKEPDRPPSPAIHATLAPFRPRRDPGLGVDLSGSGDLRRRDPRHRRERRLVVGGRIPWIRRPAGSVCVHAIRRRDLARRGHVPPVGRG